MAIFDLDKDDLLRLSDTQLEELIARLCEADVAQHGYSPACVSWSGSINAADDGIDVQVQVAAEELDTGFLMVPDTVLQAKKHTMAAADIAEEMAPNGVLSAMISHQADVGGGYVIVSLADDCSPPMRRARLEAMAIAVNGHPNKDELHFDFYDRAKLAQWLRQHPSVVLWVRDKLGQAVSGWQAFGAWSNPPEGSDDTLIAARGVTIVLPSSGDNRFGIEDAINPMRDLIRSTNKAVRITGLSGVGKTRIVQALFEEGIGDNALDRTVAIYVDAGANPDPSANAMLDRLLVENRNAIMVLDNCPTGLHSTLAAKLSASSSDVSLITVEYDIRDDKPQTTEVIQIEADGPDVAETLLVRRFPDIGQTNARKIAEFADGNARVSLAVAERVEIGESLAQLSDADLFDRLFEQRNQPDQNLRQHAEVLSLVYSFSVTAPEVGIDELEILASISDLTRNQLFRSVSTLTGRHVVQKRAHWRAILPHAIANRLAASALENIPVETLRAVFEEPGRQRLLMSFAHRLGMMHEHPVARAIVEVWLQPDGPLGQISHLDDTKAQMLDYIGPVAPDMLLERINATITAEGFGGMAVSHNPQRTTILNLLQSLAYEPEAFDRCVSLLLRVSDFEDEDNNHDAVRDKIVRLFQAYLSGTHASVDQRLKVTRDCIYSDDPKRRSLGFRMLSTALEGRHWTGSGMNDFGARPRDYGYHPNFDQLIDWRRAFIKLAVALGTSGNPEIENPARAVMAKSFRGIWRQVGMHGPLVEAARALYEHKPWGDGWKAIRSTIYFDYNKTKPEDEPKPVPESLATLQVDLTPIDLIPSINTYVFGKEHGYWALDDDFEDDDPDKYEAAEQRLAERAKRLGEEFAISGTEIAVLASDLFVTDWMPFRMPFGKGLAKGAQDRNVCWQTLVDELEHFGQPNFSFAILQGFIEEVSNDDRALAQELLDQCAQHHLLRQALVGLHPYQEFSLVDFDRCLGVLGSPDVTGQAYSNIFWQPKYNLLPTNRIVDLAELLLEQAGGADVVLDGLCMKLHNTDSSVDTLGMDLRGIGLVAATQRINRDNNDAGGMTDYRMEKVIRAALRFDEHDALKSAWLDAIFANIDASYGLMHAFDDAVQATAETMPEAFLNRVFEGDDRTRERRRLYIEQGGLDKLPLANIPVDTLIAWCQVKQVEEVWATIAGGLKHWAIDEDTKTISMTADAVSFLEAAPNVGSVLQAYASHITPRNGWVGSQADVMQERTDAISVLIGSQNPDIVMATEAVLIDANQQIDEVRRRDRARDEEREQRFE